MYLTIYHIILSFHHDLHKIYIQVFIHVFLSCVHDYLELHDGSTLNAELISRLCGNTRPSTQHSTASSMLLRFRTDTSVIHKGFKAKYSIGKQNTGSTHNLMGPKKMVFQIQPNKQMPYSIWVNKERHLVSKSGFLYWEIYCLKFLMQYVISCQQTPV